MSDFQPRGYVSRSTLKMLRSVAKRNRNLLSTHFQAQTIAWNNMCGLQTRKTKLHFTFYHRLTFNSLSSALLRSIFSLMCGSLARIVIFRRSVVRRFAPKRSTSEFLIDCRIRCKGSISDLDGEVSKMGVTIGSTAKIFTDLFDDAINDVTTSLFCHCEAHDHSSNQSYNALYVTATKSLT